MQSWTMNRRKFGGKTKKFDVKSTTLPSQKVPAKNKLFKFGGKNSAENLTKTKTYGEKPQNPKNWCISAAKIFAPNFSLVFFFSCWGRSEVGTRWTPCWGENVSWGPGFPPDGGTSPGTCGVWGTWRSGVSRRTRRRGVGRKLFRPPHWSNTAGTPDPDWWKIILKA